ncbi:MAG: penicillin-binding protein 1C, partial [Candidatus Methylumidiphilus sp.]
YYGFSLALGSAEVSLLELVNAYRSLANGGEFSPLHYRLDGFDPKPVRVLDQTAAFIIADILSDPAGRAVTFGLSNPLATRFWTAVKTGTSKDMRDNWCIGFSQRFTVGVWVGNFDGESMQEVSGVTGAAPAWLEIINALHENLASHSPKPPDGLIQREIHYQPAIEPPRYEWFMAGTDSAVIRVSDSSTQTPRIATPAKGVIIALDPDIPYENQAVIFSAKPVKPDLAFMLDGKQVGFAENNYHWKPTPGGHRLALIGQGGKVYDTVEFSVRGLNR